jgi:SAM-dependent methyltransferase
MTVIPFYGSERPDLFAIERKAQDRPRLLIEALRERVPAFGTVADVGAGDGFVARLLTTRERTVVPIEPAADMIGSGDALPWVRADAEHLPFRSGAFDGAYATWAYFFSRDWDPTPGLSELHRVVKPGGPLLVAENLGGDEFCALATEDITADAELWRRLGFTCTAIDSSFEFDDIEESRLLLSWYFGDRAGHGAKVRLTFRIGLFGARSRGPGMNL